MIRPNVVVASAIAFANCTSSSPPVPAIGPLDCFSVPETLGDYRLTERDGFEAEDAGVSYRFNNGSRDRITVIVYAASVAADTHRGRQAVVNDEGDKFEQVLPYGVARGWYSSYEMAFSEPQPVRADDRIIPGYVAGAATRRGDDLAVKVQYLYLICGQFVKVRATLPGETWNNSTVPSFAEALAVHLDAQAVPR